MIGIRADGNSQIGMGHIMRCLTIAESLRENGEQVVFFLATGECRGMVYDRGFDCHILETDFANMEDELPVLCAMMDKLVIDKLLIDSYYVTDAYLEFLRKQVLTIYLDDVDRFPYPVDLLINYNVFAKATDYPYGKEYDACGLNSLQKENGTLLLTGPVYAPVRKEFKQNSAAIKDTVKDILISMGGSDLFNLSQKIANELLEKTSATLHLVCGPFNLYKTELYALAEKEKRVIIHENVKDMWNLMQCCDMAVSAAGSTLCELAVSGVPMVIFSFVDNQKRIAQEFGRRDAAVTIGHYSADRENEFLMMLSAKVQTLCNDRSKRENLVCNAGNLVDGQGAERIAKVIIKWNKNNCFNKKQTNIQ